MRVPIVAIAMNKLGRRGRKASGFSNRVNVRPHFAQHARCDRTPNGEQYNQKNKKPKAKDFHFFMLPQEYSSSSFLPWEGQSKLDKSLSPERSFSIAA